MIGRVRFFYVPAKDHQHQRGLVGDQKMRLTHVSLSRKFPEFHVESDKHIHARGNKLQFSLRLGI